VLRAAERSILRLPKSASFQHAPAKLSAILIQQNAKAVHQVPQRAGQILERIQAKTLPDSAVIAKPRSESRSQREP
jgi:hypothetical protein